MLTGNMNTKKYVWDTVPQQTALVNRIGFFVSFKESILQIVDSVFEI